jgi:hypothetical protein
MALFGFFHPCGPDEGLAEEEKLRPAREGKGLSRRDSCEHDCPTKKHRQGMHESPYFTYDGPI